MIQKGIDLLKSGLHTYIYVRYATCYMLYTIGGEGSRCNPEKMPRASIHSEEVLQRNKCAGDVTDQSDFCIPKEDQSTVRSIETVYTLIRSSRTKRSFILVAVSVTRHILRNCSSSRDIKLKSGITAYNRERRLYITTWRLNEKHFKENRRYSAVNFDPLL